MKLVIISHTEHYISKDGTLVGWGPTVTEINHLLKIFDTIYHLAMLHSGKAPRSALPYASDQIIFIPIPTLGGKGLHNKLKTILNIPRTVGIVRKYLAKVDVFQLRTPTGIGVFLIPYLTLFSKKKGWYKYAGNWNQKTPPLGYRLQRFFLKNQSRVVTINGRWDRQPKQCLTFENPCLTSHDLEKGRSVRNEKGFDDKMTFCFVGRLERQKGVGLIIKSFNGLNDIDKLKVANVHMVGDGHERKVFETMANKSGVPFQFHGFLARDQVHQIFAESQVFLLPSYASEGFPKVIAEAMNYGCIPVVSEVSSISQYVINNESGYILAPLSEEGLTLLLQHVLNQDNDSLKGLMTYKYELLEKFSFNYYNSRIQNEILDKFSNDL